MIIQRLSLELLLASDQRARHLFHPTRVSATERDGWVAVGRTVLATCVRRDSGGLDLDAVTPRLVSRIWLPVQPDKCEAVLKDRSWICRGVQADEAALIDRGHARAH